MRHPLGLLGPERQDVADMINQRSFRVISPGFPDCQQVNAEADTPSDRGCLLLPRLVAFIFFPAISPLFDGCVTLAEVAEGKLSTITRKEEI